MTFVFTFFIIIRRRAIIECALVCYVLLDDHYVNSYNIYVGLHQYELSHFQHVYNILAFKFKL